jgi:hypothetical protein
MTVGELADRMPAAEFTEWLAFYGLEPWGTSVDDLRFGTLASVIAAPYGGKTKPDEWFVRTEVRPAGGWQEFMGAMGAFVKGPVGG